MRFYLGTTSPTWLERTDVPLFLSRRTLAPRKKATVARGPWVLDSGGFSELSLYGEWRTPHEQYVEEVRRLESEIGGLQWVAPQDWMCEPSILEKTGLTIEEHQTRTILSFERLRYALGDLVVPVLQGWTRDDYLRHWQMYEQFYFPLENEPVVGLGTVCRRQHMVEAGLIVRSLRPLKLHGFGVKIAGLLSFGDCLVSADSMAWSYRARAVQQPGPNAGYERTWRWCCKGLNAKGNGSGNCCGCIEYALRWRAIHLARLDQLRLEVECPAA